MTKEGILQIQLGDVVTRDNTDRFRVIEIPSYWDRTDEMVSLNFECIRAPSCGWCEAGDIEPMLLDDVYYPDDLTIEARAIELH